MSETPSSIFREEALEHRRRPAGEGRVIRIEPAWASPTYTLLVFVVAALALYAGVATIHEYATGPAVVLVDGRTELTAPVGGTIRGVFVKPGQRIRRGDSLLGFYLAAEEAELARMEREHDALLLRLLRDPADHAARASLSTLAADRELARARLDSRTVVAPHDGVIADVRVHRGQATSPGDALLTITGTQARGRVVALLPAQFRPMLRPGLPLRLELSGFRFAYLELAIESVGDEAIGAAEARRFLGPERGDAIELREPVVVVQAPLDLLSFRAAGETFQLYDGMVGVADARVRTESIVLALVPGLKDLFRRPN